MTRAVDRVVAALAEHQGSPHAWLVGSPCFTPPRELRQAMEQAVTQPHYDYAAPQGVVGLRQAVVELHSRQGLSLTPEQVTVTHGAKAGLVAVMGTLLRPGDELLHPVPCYPAYPAIAAALGASPIPLPREDGSFTWNREQLISCVTPRTRVLVLSSPSNPTGATLDSDHARMVVNVCREHGLRLVCDEAYEAFSHRSNADRSPAHWDPGLETVVQVRSFSKTYGVCGWRIGYVATEANLSRRVADWQAAVLNPPNTPAQLALAAAPSVPAGFSTRVRSEVHERVLEVHRTVSEAGLRATLPEGGFYVWADVRSLLAASGHDSTLGWCEDLARRNGLGLWPGEDYLAPGWVRVAAVAASDPDWRQDVIDLRERLESFMSGG